MQAVTWHAVVAPPGTPADVIKLVNGAVVEALKQPDVQQRFAELGLAAVGNPPEPQLRLRPNGAWPRQ